MDNGKRIEDVLRDALKETGQDLSSAGTELRLYAAERTAHLSLLAGQPGFSLAAQAEAQNIAMKAAQLAVVKADAIDARVVSVVQGALMALAMA